MSYIFLVSYRTVWGHLCLKKKSQLILAHTPTKTPKAANQINKQNPQSISKWSYKSCVVGVGHSSSWDWAWSHMPLISPVGRQGQVIFWSLRPPALSIPQPLVWILYLPLRTDLCMNGWGIHLEAHLWILILSTSNALRFPDAIHNRAVFSCFPPSCFFLFIPASSSPRMCHCCHLPTWDCHNNLFTFLCLKRSHSL